MSLINIRSKKAKTNYTIFSVVTASRSLSGSDTAFVISNTQTSLKFLKVGMNIVRSDGRTDNAIKTITESETQSTVTVTGDVRSEFANGATLEFTPVNALDIPLTNAQVDTNFLNLEREKLSTDGSQDLTGSLTIQKVGGTKEGNLTVKNNLTVEGKIDIGGDGASAALSLGSGDIQANNIKLDGEIDDRALFKKYYITAHPPVSQTDNNQALLFRYKTSGDKVVASSIIYLDKVTGLTTGEQTPTVSSSKSHTIVDINSEHNYILTEETNNFDKDFVVGEALNSISGAPKIKRALRPKDYLRQYQQLKVFGLDQNVTASIGKPNKPTGNSATSVRGDALVSAQTITYFYKVVLMNQGSGKLSEASDSIQLGSGSIAGTNVPLTDMNEGTFNEITFNRQTQSDYVLIYRAAGTSPTNTDFKLITVLGPEQLKTNLTGSHQDRGGFIANTWSRRNTNGEYVATTGVEHLPLDINAIASKHSRGYSYVMINSVSTTDHSVTFTGTITSDNKPADNESLRFYHDNAIVRNANSVSGDIIGGIQHLINEKKAEGRTAVKLPGGTYFSSLITIPKDFKLEGDSRFTTILKLLPWQTNVSNTRLRPTSDTFGASPTSNSNVLVSLDLASNVTLENIQINGNFVNQVKHDGDLTNFLVRANGTLNPGGTGEIKYENVALKNVIITESIEGGIYSPNTTRLSIENVDISNSGMDISTDEFAAPLWAPSATQLNIVGSRFFNFPFASNITSASEATIIGNTIKNSGEGLIAYASTNIVLSPNLILGSSGQFIGAVDTLDSEFDSINIDLSTFDENSNAAYESDTIRFLRDGNETWLADVDRTGTDGNVYVGSRISISDTINTLVKNGTLEEFISKTANAAFKFGGDDSGIIAIPSIEADRKQGLFQLRIPPVKISAIRTKANRITLKGLYNTAGGDSTFGKLIGLVYEVKATEYNHLDEGDTFIDIEAFNSLDVNGVLTMQLPVAETLISKILVGDTIAIVNGLNSTGTGAGESFGATLNNAFTTRDKFVDLTVTAVDRNQKIVTAQISTTDSNASTVFNAGAAADPFSVTKTPASPATTKPRIGIKNEFTLAKGRLIV